MYQITELQGRSASHSFLKPCDLAVIKRRRRSAVPAVFSSIVVPSRDMQQACSPATGSEGFGGHDMSVVCRKFIVSQSTGCSQPELLESLYQHFALPGAWDVYPGALEALKRIRSTGMHCHFQSLTHQIPAPPVKRMNSDVLHRSAYDYFPCASAWGVCIPQAL